jgi:hypothetical protein
MELVDKVIIGAGVLIASIIGVVVFRTCSAVKPVPNGGTTSSNTQVVAGATTTTVVKKPDGTVTTVTKVETRTEVRRETKTVLAPKRSFRASAGVVINPSLTKVDLTDQYIGLSMRVGQTDLLLDSQYRVKNRDISLGVSYEF